MNLPLVLGIEVEDVGATMGVTYTINGQAFYSYRPGTNWEDLATEDAIHKLGSALAELLR